MSRLGSFLDKIAPRTPTAKRIRRFGDKVDERIHRLEDKVDERIQRLEEKVDELLRQQKVARQWQALVKGKLDALLREQYLQDIVPNGHPFSLLARRFNLNSQNEEDGMTLALLKEIGTSTHAFVEIGCGTNGGNSGFLAEECGWRGLMIDCRPTSVAKCDKRFGDVGRVTCVCTEVTPQNINELLVAAGFTGEVDLFSLDIDSYDYWVFEAMRACSPRMLILEYNGYFGPDIAVTIPPDASLHDAPKGYHGASLAALTKLAALKGYRLLACDMAGVNAFFARNDLRPDIPGVSPSRAFRKQRDRFDPIGGGFRKEIDVIALATEKGLPLHYL